MSEDEIEQTSKQSPWPFMPAFAAGFLGALVLLVATIAFAVYVFDWTPPASVLTVVPVLGGLTLACWRWAKQIAREPTQGERLSLATASVIVGLVLSLFQLAASTPFLPEAQLRSVKDALAGGGALPVFLAIGAFVMLVQFIAMYVMYGSMTKAFLRSYETTTGDKS